MAVVFLFVSLAFPAASRTMDGMTDGRKRILFTASSAPRFAGDATAPFILNMAQDLCDLGWQVDLLAPHAHGLKRRETIGDVTIHRFRYFFPSWLQALTAEGGALSNLRRSRLVTLQIPFFVAGEAAALYRLMRHKKYDLVHSHWLIPQGYIGQKICRMRGVPHIVSVHGPDVHTYNQSFIRPFKTAAIERSLAVIANSRETESAVLQLCNKTPVHLIPTGTTPCAPDAVSPLSRSDYCENGDKLIVFLGRLVREKGAHVLIEALPLIRKTHKASVLLIGAGIERVDLEMQARKLGVRDQVYFTGSVPHDRIYDYLLLGDALAAPYVTAEEETVLAEAMFAGLPVVVCAAGGIPDLVTNNETGLLVPVHSPDALAAALIRIFDDPALSRRLAANGRFHATAHFSRRGTAEKVAALYQDVLSRSAVC